MKTAYELAMERLNKSAPRSKLTGEQKQRLAELDSRYAAQIAGREIALQSEMEKTAAAGNFEDHDKLQEQLLRERRTLQAELEEKKEQVRAGKRPR
jgi:hypothetical protein